MTGQARPPESAIPVGPEAAGSHPVGLRPPELDPSVLRPGAGSIWPRSSAPSWICARTTPR